jgi:YesN/AraC family two-component response regulator
VQILRSHRHEVIEAADGVEALKLLDKYAVDLVITDLIMLPGLDGFALVTRIRQKLPAAPIVIISGYTAQFAAPALNEATEFLPKPIDPPVLIATVQRLLAQSPKLYRRKQQSEVWHFCGTCSHGPARIMWSSATCQARVKCATTARLSGVLNPHSGTQCGTHQSMARWTI